ncbi:hypothetical protein INR75_06635 [Zunongwangia sp. SCSIO 43204]|uniref:hypothetical protein n=1 Tax=Zunongwangia sp. SCSIO 43204 TaxID=2779359 RepID=UPI001CA80108|nr:hypothetical protein [Zunongwangia sp. SCSIO 43204]UAB85685.1 hypothetical protein INR75_06635 [Zunongwangia sp. SCSIO 43204]
MAECFIDEITGDITVNCDHMAVTGIESDIVLIPFGAEDKTGSAIDETNSQLITDLVLKAGKTGFKLEGIKQTNSHNSEFVPGDNQTLDGHRHRIGFRILSPTTANRAEANKLSKGGKYIAVVNRKYKGPSDQDAFLVLGWQYGMKLVEMTENSLENKGAIVGALQSEDDALEMDLPKNLLDADYDTTLTAFNNKFEQAAV